MKIFDISRPYFHTPVYPGDPVPSLSWLSRVEKGEGYNLSSFSGCVHTATHADAPLHVWSEGQTIDKMPLELFYGECFVVSASGILTEEWVDQLMMGKKKRRDDALKLVTVPRGFTGHCVASFLACTPPKYLLQWSWKEVGVWKLN